MTNLHFKYHSQTIATKTEDFRIFRLIDPFLFAVDNIHGARYHAIVPAGFSTNYASVPQFLHSLIDPQGKQARAAIAHDYLYGTGEPRAWCDAVLRAALQADGCPPWRRWLIWLGVRVFGRRYWVAAQTLN